MLVQHWSRLWQRLGAIVLFAPTIMAQDAPLWIPIERPSSPQKAVSDPLEVLAWEEATLSTARLRLVRSEFERRWDVARLEDGRVHLPLPGPYGELETFLVEQVDDGAYGQRRPEVSAWRGVSAESPSRHVSLARYPRGLWADVVEREGDSGFGDTYTVRAVADDVYEVRPLSSDPSTYSWACDVNTVMLAPAGPAPGTSWGGDLQVLRLVLACTGEYSVAISPQGDRDQVQAAIRSSLDRVNQIFERDLGLRLVLVPGTEALFFTDPDTDEFDHNNDALALMDESQEVISKHFGADQYDIGHTLGTCAGGYAYAGAGQPQHAARGATGSKQPWGETFNVHFLAHELAHQLGARHTFNGKGGACGENDNHDPLASVEPGSGATIMSYHGICDGDDLDGPLIDSFHAVSLEEMRAHLRDYGGNFRVPVPMANQAPLIDAGPDFVIPKATPFRLWPKSVKDLDWDPLTYSWEQIDRGLRPVLLGEEDTAKDPLFRAFRPSKEREREFPRLEDLLSGTVTKGERLPGAPRDLNFRFIVRDNHSKNRGIYRGSGVAYDDVLVRVVDAGPFELKAPFGTVRAGDTLIEWETNGTDKRPINCQRVRIHVSIDGGKLQTLYEGPNTGTAQVNLFRPGWDTVRFLIESESRRFFTLSDEVRVLPAKSSITFVPSDDEKARISAASLAASRTQILRFEGGAYQLATHDGVTSIAHDAAATLLMAMSSEPTLETTLVLAPRSELEALIRCLGEEPSPEADRYLLLRSLTGSEYIELNLEPNGACNQLRKELRGAWQQDKLIYGRSLEFEKWTKALWKQHVGADE